MICFKILITDGVMNESDVSLFLKAGSLVDKNNQKSKPPNWFPDDSALWPNILALSQHKFAGSSSPFFKQLPDYIINSSQEWINFFNNPTPENSAIPDFETRMIDDKLLGDYLRICLIRSSKPDRTIIAANQFILSVLKDKKFVETPPEDIKTLVEISSKTEPVLYLLSAGADPTATIDDLSRDRKKEITKISLGEGQEEKARAHIMEAVGPGNWILLQNCHLGLGFMQELDTLLGDADFAKTIHNEFRIWMSCEPRQGFPLGLLQRSIKVTNEAPIGMKAGMSRTYKQVINPEFIEKIDHSIWRTLTYATCFFHSLV